MTIGPCPDPFTLLLNGEKLLEIITMYRPPEILQDLNISLLVVPIATKRRSLRLLPLDQCRVKRGGQIIHLLR